MTQEANTPSFSGPTQEVHSRRELRNQDLENLVGQYRNFLPPYPRSVLNLMSGVTSASRAMRKLLGLSAATPLPQDVYVNNVDIHIQEGSDGPERYTRADVLKGIPAVSGSPYELVICLNPELRGESLFHKKTREEQARILLSKIGEVTSEDAVIFLSFTRTNGLTPEENAFRSAIALLNENALKQGKGFGFALKLEDHGPSPRDIGYGVQLDARILALQKFQVGVSH